MIKLNWRKYPDAVPEQEVRGCMKLCIVRIQYINGLNELVTTIMYDWYNPNVRVLDEYGNEDYIGKWTENDGEVTHWFYADELPPPEEMIMKYFSYDPSDADGLELHNTADEAKLRAQSCIPEMLDCDGRWEERVNLVCWGEIREIATKTDVINVDDRGFGEDGVEYSTDIDYMCNYKLTPLQE